MAGYRHQGRLYTARPAGFNRPASEQSRGSMQVGDRRIDLTVAHGLGGLTIVGVAPDGSVAVRLEEVADVVPVQVDQTVRRYAADGTLLGMARFPLVAQYTYVAHGLAVGPDGAVYALMTRPDHVEVQRLRFRPELPPILPPAGAAPVERLATYTASDGGSSRIRHLLVVRGEGVDTEIRLRFGVAIVVR